jgi:RHS repeat-associated protein
MSTSATTSAAGKDFLGCGVSVRDPPFLCMEWNAENQLTRVTKNGAEVARYAYDPRGRRVENVVSGVPTSYNYDGDSLLRKQRGTVSLKYVHGTAIDEPLAADDGAALTYFHADALGSIGMVTSGSGAVTLTRQYDAWGIPHAGADQPGDAFTGREWDPETGLYYYRARYYDPGAGRFIDEDPIGFYGSFNFYGYVANNPTNWTDPLGLYHCYYYIVSHMMVCEPDNPDNPWYHSDHVTSGQNSDQEVHDPAHGKSYSTCDDCRDNPKRTNRSGRGPAPEGHYTVGPMGGAAGHPQWRALTPVKPVGRSGIYTHFCPNPTNCSEGCVSFTDRQDFDLFNRDLSLEKQNSIDIIGGGGVHRCHSCGAR